MYTVSINTCCLLPVLPMVKLSHTLQATHTAILSHPAKLRCVYVSPKTGLEWRISQNTHTQPPLCLCICYCSKGLRHINRMGSFIHYELIVWGSKICLALELILSQSLSHAGRKCSLAEQEWTPVSTCSTHTHARPPTHTHTHKCEEGRRETFLNLTWRTLCPQFGSKNA